MADRVIARVRNDTGPTLVVVAGLHGNEPAGVEAIHRVAEAVPSDAIRGELLLVCGNLTALNRGVRYVDRDLNRDWWPDRIRALRNGGAADEAVETEEQRALMDALDPVLSRASRPAIVLDLHTTSGDTPPFVTVGDTLRNRRFARAFPLPLVLGLEEQLEATFLEYVNGLGCITLGCEGGRHDDPASVDRLEAVVWVALVAARLLDRQDLPDTRRPWRVLRQAAVGAPEVVEVRHRHPVSEPGDYIMAPDFASFQRVRESELLGVEDGGREVRAVEDGRLLMPLYQDQGSDAFFLIRDVRPVWLTVSAAVRRLRLDLLAPLLPGVRRDRRRDGAVIVDRRVARWYAIEIFHLLGFRREVERGHELVMSRRHFDTPSP